MQNLITQHLDIWTTAHKTRSTAGRGSNNKLNLHGIKKLRELILELAVRGKLVPQDPSDEPASELLKKIAAEKTKLIKEGKIKKEKPLPEISDEEKPFELPIGWEWCRLPDIGELARGKSKHRPRNDPKLYLDGTIPLIQTGDVARSGKTIQSYSALYNDFGLAQSRLWPKGTMCITIAANIADTGLLGIDACFPDSVVGFLPHDKNISVTYFESFIKVTKDHLEKFAPSTAQKNINLEILGDLLVPCPPQNEINRIVSKVDELMAFCDQLEQTQSDNIAALAQLVEALLATLITTDGVYARNAGAISGATNSSNHNELQNNWQRISAHFDTLFTTEHSIDQLKQTILQLAVMGKLVPQNPNDEPASELLKKIAAEKAQLIKEGKIKKEKPLPEITDEEKPFELPSGWEWAFVGDVIALKNGYAFKSQYFSSDPTPYVLTTPGNFYETGGFRDREHKTKYYSGVVDSEFILQAGDLIIPMTEQAPGLLGSAAFIPSDGKTYIHNQRLGKLIPYSKVLVPDFIALFFNAPYLRRQLAETCSGTTVRHTSPDRIFNVLFPVCSPSEQHRIVTKVDELMTLCNTLKTNLQNAQSTQLALADALVERAVN